MQTRRDVLTTALAASAALALPAPAQVLATPTAPLTFQSSPLLLEFRHIADLVIAMEAIDPLEPLYALDAAGLLPSSTSEEVEALANPYATPHTAAIESYLAALAPLARQIWARPASSWQDIVDLAELAKFWNRGSGYAEYHGYDDTHADMRLIDAVRVVALRPASQVASFPTFEAPPVLLEWRQLDQERAALLAEREWTRDEQTDFRSREFHLERALLKEPADSMTWTDVVVRAEITCRWRQNCRKGCSWILLDDEDDKTRFTHQRAFAELAIAILELARCPARAELDD